MCAKIYENIIHSSTTCKIWIQHNCLSIVKGQEIWAIYKVEHWTAMGVNRLRPHTARWWDPGAWWWLYNAIQLELAELICVRNQEWLLQGGEGGLWLRRTQRCFQQAVTGVLWCGCCLPKCSLCETTLPTCGLSSFLHACCPSLKYTLLVFWSNSMYTKKNHSYCISLEMLNWKN